MKFPWQKTNKLAAAEQPVIKKSGDSYSGKIAKKSTSQTRQDIASWNSALRQANSVESPKRVLLQKLYNNIMLDALLTSQLENRRMITTSAPFTIKKGDTTDDQTTALLKSLPWFSDLTGHIVDTQFTGSALIEFVTNKEGIPAIKLLPKTNVIPNIGTLLLDETNTTGIDYRNTKEYGNWLIEIGDSDDLGLLNKAVPHVLFKRFAQSCWSELCEIYGIPPRVLKTNTQDAAMLSRGESMMRDMGAAAWFIIDDSESFEFAKGADTNGDVYSNIIRLCNNEMSLLISGAVIGQDTKNGNESKEKISVEQLMKLADGDKRLVEATMNTVVLPAMFKIGIVPDGLTFAFDAQENTAELFERTKELLQFYEVDPEWVKGKFSVEVTAIKPGGTGSNFQKPGQQD